MQVKLTHSQLTETNLYKMRGKICLQEEKVKP